MIPALPSAVACAAAALLVLPQGGEKLHLTWHWHMEQPIYWPDQQQWAPDRYERAWESIQRTDQGAAHPEHDLRAIFGKADWVAAYQWRVRDSIQTLLGWPEAGAQVSYSGGLIENVRSLGDAGQLGYGPTWSSVPSTIRSCPSCPSRPSAGSCSSTGRSTRRHGVARRRRPGASSPRSWPSPPGSSRSSPSRGSPGSSSAPRS